jgi:CubicO group peptidase (beta-lactamase class C family)
MIHIMHLYFFNKINLQFKAIFFFSVLVSFNSIFNKVQAQIKEAGQVEIEETSNPIHQWPKSIPESVGMSSSRLANLDSIFVQHIEQKKIPGMVALIVRNGFVVYEKAFGIADPETNQSYQTDHIFRIASQTKAITATAVMMLWEKGLFNLDDPISNYIPEFKDITILKKFNASDSTYRTIPAKNQITIRHLLNHTSGIGYGIIDGDERIRKIYQKAGVVDLYTTEDISIEQSVKRLAKLPLHHEPGERFTYSEGLDVLGYLVEIISGQPFNEFLEEHLFEPLGMSNTQFYLSENQNKLLVPVQTKNQKGEWIVYVGHPDGYYNANYPKIGAKKFYSGGAGLTSTAQDYAKFLQMYLNGGEFNEHRILSPTTIDLIMSNQTFELFGDGNTHHGLAFGVVTSKGFSIGGRGSVGTFDWGGYFNTQYYADPELNIIGILMKQTQRIPWENTGNIMRQVVGASVIEK